MSGNSPEAIETKNGEFRDYRNPVKFIIICNQMPDFRDSSGAFASRLLMLRLKRSFLGNEDLDLRARLRSELPGALLWGLEGLRRQHQRGRFVQPTSGAELLDELADAASPIAAFMRDRCVIAPDKEVSVKLLLEVYNGHLRDQRIPARSPDRITSRQLHAALPEVKTGQRRRGFGRERVFCGLDLTDELRPQADMLA